MGAASTSVLDSPPDIPRGGIWVPRFRHGVFLLGILTGGAFPLCPTAALASLTYSNPFHPEQCAPAVRAARRALEAHPEDSRARSILAEGLLCLGLETDDPWALAAAIAAFQARISAGSSDFFDYLYLAEALRRRYPLADAVPTAFEHAAAQLTSADVGAARDELAAYLGTARQAVEAHRRQFLPLLERRAAQLELGTLTASRLLDLLVVLAQTGPAGVDRALEVLEARLARRYDPTLDTFYRAEILRGRGAPAAVAALYRATREALCRGETPNAPGECARAAWRLEQLDTIQQQEEGG